MSNVFQELYFKNINIDLLIINFHLHCGHVVDRLFYFIFLWESVTWKTTNEYFTYPVSLIIWQAKRFPNIKNLILVLKIFGSIALLFIRTLCMFTVHKDLFVNIVILNKHFVKLVFEYQ